jgi:hypothetical protein
VAAIAVAGPALAQPGVIHVGPPAPELRADVLAARATTWQLGAGLFWPVGRSVRLGGVLAAGVTDGAHHGAADEARAASGRAEFVTRFVLDGAGQSRWRPYGAAGAGVLFVRGVRGVARVHVAAGLEMPPVGRWRPAAEVGLGGGVRVALALRRTGASR